jgi:hypothetical protein
MRRLIALGLAAGLLAAPALASAAEKDDLHDARCIAALVMMSDQKKVPQEQAWIVRASMLYSYGRLEGRNQKANLPALLRESLQDEDEASLVDRAAACIDNIGNAMASMTVSMED